MTHGIFEFAIVAGVAAILALVARLVKQPLILAYIATGIILNLVGGQFIEYELTFGIFSELGLTFLLFLIGLEINYTAFKRLGFQALILGVSQLVFTAGLGFLLSNALGFAFVPSIIISAALAFSSTVVVVKLLSEKRDLHSMYGRLSLGMLLVQDLVAVLFLIVLSGFKSAEGIGWAEMATIIIKALTLIGVMFWLGRRLLPAIFDRIARSQELLFLISIAWVFIVASLVEKMGFSIEIGGLLAGLALANSSENFEIAARIRPLRDFFVITFFVMLGATLPLIHLAQMATPVLIFSLFVLIGNPLIVLIIMGLMGHHRRTSFMTAISIAQVSEFSIILALTASKLGYIEEPIVSLVTGVTLCTMLVSTYGILHGEKLYRALNPFLRIFERRKMMRTVFEGEGEISRPIVLIGFHRTGQSIALNIPKQRLLIIDFDPEIARRLRQEKFAHLLGDISDAEIIERAHLDEAALVISTSPDVEDNLSLVETTKRFKRKNKWLKVLVRAENEKEAELLYEKGADYVLLPHLTAGEYLGKLLSLNPDLGFLERLKARDREIMRQEKAALGVV